MFNKLKIRLRALRSFGGVERVKEESRDERGLRLLDESRQDLGYGLRRLRQAPGFTLIAVLTLALVLGTIGTYSVMAYSVSQSRQEIGLRMALGAQPADVLRFVMKQGLALIAGGVVIGPAGAFILTRLMANLLFEIGPTDPVTFCGVTLLLAAAALLACYLPARRALKVDPLIILRHE